jgi:hypothetical protein
MKEKLPFKPLDFAVIALSLGILIFVSLAVYAAPDSAPRVVIQGSGRTWIFPLDAEEQIAVPGPEGETVIEISGGRARVFSSPCANQTCVAAGHIHRQGEWAACLPNKVIVSIEGSSSIAGSSSKEVNDSETVDAFVW